MAPIIHPGLSSCSLGLCNLICMVYRNGINTTAVDIKMLAKILHRHSRAFNMPARISSAPWRIPGHCLSSKFRVSEPENKILGILFVRIYLDSRSASQIIDTQTCELTVIRNGIY